MVAVFGDLRPQDDYTHAPGPEPDFNESAYYNFFDQGQGLGGWMRIGNRVNEGYAEVTLALYLPDGSVLFSYQRPEISGNDAFEAAGMRFQVLEPFLRHRTTYEGETVLLTDPVRMADQPGQTLREGPRRQVRLDLQHEAIGPVFGAGGQRPAEGLERVLGQAHFEQHMRISGSIEIDGERLSVDALGLRDHSWGPRTWQAIPRYRWLPCAFSPDLGIRAWIIYLPDGSVAQEMVVARGPERLERAAELEFSEELRPGTPYQHSFAIRATLESGERLEVQGRVRSLLPLRNRRAGHVTSIGEAMTEYLCNGLAGLGISEYLEQVR
jgi:hypothetical protein